MDNHVVLVVVDARTGYKCSITPSLDSVHGQGPGIIVGWLVWPGKEMRKISPLRVRIRVFVGTQVRINTLGLDGRERIVLSYFGLGGFLLFRFVPLYKVLFVQAMEVKRPCSLKHLSFLFSFKQLTVIKGHRWYTTRVNNMQAKLEGNNGKLNWPCMG